MVWQSTFSLKLCGSPRLLVNPCRSATRTTPSFGALFTGPEALRPYWPGFAYNLQDLSTYSDEELRGEAVLRVALLALKTVFARDAAARLPQIFAR